MHAYLQSLLMHEQELNIRVSDIILSLLRNNALLLVALCFQNKYAFPQLRNLRTMPQMYEIWSSQVYLPRTF